MLNNGRRARETRHNEHVLYGDQRLSKNHMDIETVTWKKTGLVSVGPFETTSVASLGMHASRPVRLEKQKQSGYADEPLLAMG